MRRPAPVGASRALRRAGVFVLGTWLAGAASAQVPPVDVRASVTGARLGAGYLFGPDVKGWSVGLSLEY